MSLITNVGLSCSMLTDSKSNQSNQIKFICDKKNVMQHKKNKANVDRTQRQYETALTSALQNKNTTTGI